jgi:PKD repeat protein
MQTKTYIFVTVLFVFFSQIVPASKALAKAKAGPDQKVDQGDMVILDGSASKLPHGIHSYQWEQTGGTPAVILVNADKAKASFTAPDVGGAGTLLRFKLTVSNNSGDSDTDTTKVTVRAANRPPSASFTASPTSGEVPLKVNFDASGSLDPDGSISSYWWDFGDGATSSGVKISHTYTKVGTYTAKLTVTDNDGAADMATRTITVRAANRPPVANHDSYSTDEDTPFTVAKPGVLVNDSDPEGDSLKAIEVSNPSNGTLNFFKSDGSFRYTPNAGFNGTTRQWRIMTLTPPMRTLISPWLSLAC